MPKNSRLDQLLSSLGYCSRSQVRALIHEGRVEVKEVEKPKPELRVDPKNVFFDGEALEHPEGLFILLHKPVGYVCSHSDEEGLNVYSLLPERWNLRSPKIVSVGRLDRDTSGLLLLTDQHELVHRLTSPKKKVMKRYLATLEKDLDEATVKVFASGELLLRGEDKPCLPANVKSVNNSRQVAVEIFEGRYHQVRRMFAACGNHVEALHRSHFGPWDLEGIASGEFKNLDPQILNV